MTALAAILCLTGLQDAPTKEELHKWMRWLGNDNSERREHATKMLIGAGEPAIDTLEARLKSAEDPEVGARLKHILRDIDTSLIEMTVECSKSFSPGRKIPATLVVTNRSRKPVTLYLGGFQVAVDPPGWKDANAAQQGKAGRQQAAHTETFYRRYFSQQGSKCTLSDSQFVTLKPGERKTITRVDDARGGLVPLDFPVKYRSAVAHQRQRFAGALCAKPGKYRMTATYTYTQADYLRLCRCGRKGHPNAGKARTDLRAGVAEFSTKP